jgi:hypothetical protein
LLLRNTVLFLYKELRYSIYLNKIKTITYIEDVSAMSFKENFKNKMRLDKLVERTTASMRETPGQRSLNKDAVREILEATDFKYSKVRGLNLYVRPLNAKSSEVLVLDNELPIYHSSVEDVAMRKTPHWKEMLSFGNVKRILNDQDVVISRGKESLKRIHEIALSQIDLSFTRKDMEELVEDAQMAFEKRSPMQVRELLELFIDLLGFEPLPLGILEQDFDIFARPKLNGEEMDIYQDLIAFNDERLQLFLVKGDFSPDSDLELAQILQILQGGQKTDLQGANVFTYLADLALKEQPMLRTGAREHGLSAVPA